MVETGQLFQDRVLQNRYDLRQKLGQAPGRQTWLAADRQTQEAVVVKLIAVHDLNFSDRSQWEVLKLAEREAEVLRQLSHPRIPKYRDAFSLSERLQWFGLVQDYIPGRSLQALLAKGHRFSEAQIRQIAQQVLQILVYLHQLPTPVLHRDIKPSNLVWGKDNQLYLVDFGAVQNQAAIEGASFTVVGTYGYAPMEQYGGQAVPASDLYSLGTTLIHLVTGTAPADLPQQDLKIQFADRVSLSANLVCWIEKLAEPDLEQRFQTARAALRVLQAQATLDPRPAPVRSAAKPVPKPKPPLDKPLQTAIVLHQTDDCLELHHPGVGIWQRLLGGTKPFAIRFDSFQLTLWRSNVLMMQEEIRSIDAIFFDTAPTEGAFAVTIQMGIEEFSFGQTLLRCECEWIAKLLSAWLVAH